MLPGCWGKLRAGEEDTATVTDADRDGSPAGEDCDDADPGVFPGAAETCDGRDEDCDGAVDEGAGAPAWADRDGDGFGDPATETRACEVPAGLVRQAGDCDDADAGVSPGAAETCDDRDEDCDGEVDEGAGPAWYADTDGDGYGDPASATVACDAPTGHVADDHDCDDADAAVHPDTAEVCNGVDDDCDGDVDEDDAADAAIWYLDADGDGHGDPASPMRSCDQPTSAVADDTDCDDTDPDVSPSSDETCDGRDDDCDGTVDEDDAVDAATWYADTDADGYGAATSGATVACLQPSGHVATDDDCDDAAADVNPAGVETCDGRDEDCDGTVDEDDAVDALTWYADSDGDGFGDASAPAAACLQPSGTVSDDTDCDDTVATAYPGSTATETPFDGVDQDCDGLDVCTDLDCDGLPDLVVPTYYAGAYATYTGSSYAYTQGTGFAEADRSTFPGYGMYDAAAGDLDGDGYVDLIFPQHYDGATYVQVAKVWMGSTTGFTAGADLPAAAALDVLVEDLDGDGWLDVVFANYHNGSALRIDSYVYWGSAAGLSASNRDDLPTNGARKVLAEDFDQDGYTDLAFCGYYGGGFSTNSHVYYGSAGGFDPADVSALPTIGCLDVASGDVNGDGYADLAFSSHYNGSTYSGTAYVYYGSASGFSSSSGTGLPVVGGAGVGVGDFDGDGYADVALGGYYPGDWTQSAPTRVHPGSATGVSASTYTDLGSKGIRNVTVADLDGDGADELVGALYYTGSSFVGDSVVWWGGAGGLSDARTTLLPTHGAHDVAVADLDRDGTPDILLSQYYSGAWTAFVDDLVYWGDAGRADRYDASDVTALGTRGTAGAMLPVGVTDW